MKILVVEDDPVCNLFQVKCLEAVGTVETAADGEAGLESIRRRKPRHQVNQLNVFVGSEIKKSGRRGEINRVKH